VNQSLLCAPLLSTDKLPSAATFLGTVILHPNEPVPHWTAPAFIGTAWRGGLVAISVASVMASASVPDAQAALLYTVTPLGPTEPPVSRLGNNLTDAIGNTNSGNAIEYTLVGTKATRGYEIANRTSGNTTSGTTTLSLTPSTPGLFSASLSGTTVSSATSQTVTVSVTPTARTGATIAGTFTLTGNNPNNQNYPGKDSNDYTKNTSDNLAFTFHTQAVAPIASVASATTTVTSRVGTSTAAVASVTVKNTGDGNLSGLGAVSNLNGTVSSSLPALTGGGAVSLADSASQTYSFTYAPTARGSTTATITTGLSNGNADGTGVTKTFSVNVAAVGPVYEAKHNSATIGDGGKIMFTSYGGADIQYKDLTISNITSDTPAGNLTDLNLTFSIISDPTNEFSISLNGGSYGNTASFVSSAGGLAGMIANVSVQFNNKVSGGDGFAQLRVATDEGAAFNGAGAIYIYNLAAIPEPGTIMVLGTGLLGLAIARRRGQARKVAALRLTDPDAAAPTG